mgnify:CR=1 FL=1|jgi:hypothetical protein|tara:strand:- start:317 stop:700 length:384 start_codon:yes stop_codon:yes gene_type:complete
MANGKKKKNEEGYFKKSPQCPAGWTHKGKKCVREPRLDKKGRTYRERMTGKGDTGVPKAIVTEDTTRRKRSRYKARVAVKTKESKGLRSYDARARTKKQAISRARLKALAFPSDSVRFNQLKKKKKK